ncbi:sulfotransferase [Rhodosalinus sp. FB01]|uniref:sulfotransferase n=1 Tax=Rhodosalinus sp. FB01 TaxID=3239194 RepID=UPI003524A4C0
MAQPLLLFGLGATKAGSGWLYRYLRGHPECRMKSVKELHFFDTLQAGRRPRRLRKLDAAISAEARRADAGQTRALRRVSALQELAEVTHAATDAAYLDYLMRGRGEARLVGDITPAYALLPADWLRRMQALSPGTRFVYLMRDPLARLWSNLRMVARRDAEGAALGPRANRLMAEWLDGGHRDVAARGDYAGVLSRLDAALEPARLFLGFFEEVVTAPVPDALCRFLGLTPRPAAATPVHEGVPATLDPDLRARALARLAPQYDTVAARMGRLPPSWQASCGAI